MPRYTWEDIGNSTELIPEWRGFQVKGSVTAQSEMLMPIADFSNGSAANDQKYSNNYMAPDMGKYHRVIRQDTYLSS